MILEEPDALRYAVRHHGIVKPLFEKVAVVDDAPADPAATPKPI
jgi:hypothetical protein